MASLTIRNLDDPLKATLRVRAAQHGRSMEEEARVILRSALTGDGGSSRNLAEEIQTLFAPFGGVELPPVARGPTREPPDFSE